MTDLEPNTEPDESHSKSWPAWASDRAPRGVQRRKELLGRFAYWMNKYSDGLWAGKKGFELGTDEHEALRNKLLITANNLSERRILANWWDSLISAGNKSGIWKISFPGREVVLPDTPPAFVHRDFQLLHRYRRIEEGFLKLIAKGIQQDQLKDAALCSAVFFGGIASNERLAALCALESADLNGDGSLLWAMLQVPDGSKANRKTRWYPDAMTGCLLVRLRESNTWTSSLKDNNQSHPLIQAIGSLGLEPWPNGWSERWLLRAVQVALGLEHTGVIAAYLSEGFVSHSLPESGLHRIAKWSISESDSGHLISTPLINSPNSSFNPHVPTFKAGVNFSSQREIARKVASVLKQRRQVIIKLNDLQKQYAEEMWPITYHLVEWAKWRIRPDTDEKGIRPVSVLRYFRPLAKYLIYEAESEDILSLDVEDFETLYELTAASVKGNAERAKVWSILRNFHDFMFLCGTPDIDFRELDGWTSDQLQVNVSANLVSETEFMKFKEAFFNKEQGVGNLTSRRVFFAAMLGFRAGLRRREIQMMQMRDYHPGPEPFLLIRPSKFATLKSNSSNRRIPLKPLLPPDELSEFVAFLEQRAAVLGRQPGFVFAENDSPDTPPLQSRLIDPVTKAFQLICGEGRGNFCFHHLRHSFSNWIFLALLASDQPELLSERANFIDSDLLRSEQIQTIRNSFFPRLQGTPSSPDRRHLYQVAALMGHLSPFTTLRSYLHLLDWIAMRSLDIALGNKLAAFEMPALGRICGFSPSAPYKKPYRNLADQPTAFLREFIRARGSLKKEPAPEKLDISEELQKLRGSLNVPTIPSLRLAMTLVGRRMELENSNNLARNFSISPHKIEETYRAYLRMYAKQSVKKPKIRVIPPAAPRVNSERIEFWRIIEATEHAYYREENRHFLNLAAECLIRRNGPRTGKLYFGKHVKDAPDIARGILLMGIEPDQIKLVLRQVSQDAAIGHSLAGLVEAIRDIGIKVVMEPLDWESKSKIIDRLRLEVITELTSGSGGIKRSEGRIRGLNYAAMWIRFVNESK